MGLVLTDNLRILRDIKPLPVLKDMVEVEDFSFQAVAMACQFLAIKHYKAIEAEADTRLLGYPWHEWEKLEKDGKLYICLESHMDGDHSRHDESLSGLYSVPVVLKHPRDEEKMPGFKLDKSGCNCTPGTSEFGVIHHKNCASRR